MNCYQKRAHVIIPKMLHFARTHALNSLNILFYFILLRCTCCAARCFLEILSRSQL